MPYRPAQRFFFRSIVERRFRLRSPLSVINSEFCCVRRSRLTAVGRLFWAGLSDLWAGWRSALVIVKPETENSRLARIDELKVYPDSNDDDNEKISGFARKLDLTSHGILG